MSAENKTIFVKSNLKEKSDGSHPLAIFEKDERHPTDGEAWVAGDIVVEVFPTKGIITALRNDRIVEVTKSGDVKARSKVEEASRKETPEASETERRNAPSADAKIDSQPADKR